MKRILLAICLMQALFSYAQVDLLKDINLLQGNLDGSWPRNIIGVDGVIFFTASTEAQGRELWTSDGSDAGTFLVRDITEGFGSTTISNITAAGSIVYFTVTDDLDVDQLWKSDGTEDGTVMVMDTGKPDMSNLTEYNDEIYFSLDTNEEFWKSDGTEGGTVRVGTLTNASGMTVSNGTLFLRAQDSVDDGVELWKTDGTDVGTELVKDINPLTASSTPSTLTDVSGVLYFVADDGSNGAELWKSDGTSVGTELVKDVNNVSSASSIGRLIDVDGTLFFVADDGTNGMELWKSDGTNGGTIMVKNINPSGGSSPDRLYAFGSTLYLSADAGDGTSGELWTSDGTEIGTIRLSDINPSGESYIYDLVGFEGELYFTGTPSGGPSANEIWKTDGTVLGTVGVSDGTTFSSIQNMTVLGSNLLFSASTLNLGVELLKSDGTQEGTQVVRNVQEATASAFLGGFFSGTELGDQFFFAADDDYDPGIPISIPDLWATDATTENTTKLMGFNDSGPTDLVATSTDVFFFTSFSELWKSDGVSTSLVKDINPAATFRTFPYSTVLGNNVVFTADDGTNGAEIWISDGTNGGTNMILDIDESGSSSPKGLEVMGSEVFFNAISASGQGLWKTDGTASGTVEVKQIDELGTSFVVVGDELFFTVDQDKELWKSDGTSAGTQLVKQISSADFSIQELTNANDYLIFRANNGTDGIELWRSDGTETGTFMIDLNPGPSSSAPGAFFYNPLDDFVYFGAIDHTTGFFSFWKTDGTVQGSTVIDDEAGITEYAIFQDQLYYTVNRRLFVTDGSPSGTKEIETGKEIWDLKAFNNELLLIADADLYGREVFTLSKIEQIITFDVPTGKTYGDAAFDLTATSSEGLAITYESSDPAIASIDDATVTIHNAGTAMITASQAGSGLVDAAFASGSLEIVRKDLTITAVDQTVSFGEEVPFDLTYDGFVLGDDASDLDVPPFTSALLQPINAGVYDIEIDGAEDNNYEIVHINGTLTVEPLTAQITLSNLTQDFDGSAKEPQVTTDPVDLVVNLTFDGSSTVPSAVGNYDVVATIDELNYEGSISDVFEIISTLGLTNLKELTVYPNPTTRYISVPNPGVLHVFSMNGSLLLKQGVSAGKRVDISSFNSGQYLLILIDKKGIYRQEVIIKK